MSLTPEDRVQRRREFRAMGAADKVNYLFTYYKLPILLSLIALVLLIGGIHRRLTQKEVLLYAANVNVSMGDDVEEVVYDDFVSAAGYDPKKAEVYLYRALYLSDNAAESDHQYAYASRLKLLAAINSKQLDIVLMNREAYDIFSNNGYLLPLPEFLSEGGTACAQLEPYMTSNQVIIDDNSVEYELNEADTYQAVIEEVVNALDLTEHPLFRRAGYPDSVYLGVIANSVRLPAVHQYLDHLNALAADTEDLSQTEPDLS